jgi:N-acyl homoserine lactone hydrolase
MRLFVFENGVYKPNGDPFPGFLVQTDSDFNILIDTGITPEDAARLNQIMGANDVEVGESRLLLNILDGLGISPSNIHAVINTHFHYDHCGYNRSFPQAEFYVQKSHYEYALSSTDPAFGLVERHWEDPALHYHLLEGDQEILPGIHVIRTDGHVRGIQSVLIELPKSGNILIASDAMRDSRMLASDVNPAQYSMFDTDPVLVNEGVKKLKRSVIEKNIQQVIFNHDGRVWPTYKKAPDFYD